MQCLRGAGSGEKKLQLALETTISSAHGGTAATLAPSLQHDLLSSPGTAAYSWLRRAISWAVAPSQPPPHLDWALLWPAPGHAKGGEHRLGFASILSQSALLLRGTGVRSGLGVNAFKQLHLNIKSNLPPPFGTGAFAEPDELYLCAGGEGKGAGEPSGLTWEHAGMVHETHLRVACPCSEYGGSRPGWPVLLAPLATGASGC